MENPDLIKTKHVGKTNEIATSTKKVYNAPQLQPYGNLSELVQNFPARAADGGVADCTFC